MIAYHWLPADMKLRNGDDRLIQIGTTVHVPRDGGMPLYGVLDVLWSLDRYDFLPKDVLCKVDITCDVSVSGNGKVVTGFNRTCLDMRVVTDSDKDRLLTMDQEIWYSTLKKVNGNRD